MALLTLFPTDNGIARLLLQPGDIVPRDANQTGRKEHQAPASLRELFASYRNDLRLAYDVASLWWEGTVEAQMDLGHGPEDALKEAFDSRLAGPAAHPNIVWIVRSYWLLCSDTDVKSTSFGFAYPEEVLLQWLIDAGETELVRLIACMPYWPIGLDENGNWC
ncbi:MAG: hypothetical protein FD152_188 [Xanthobacteraceae bacterium]|nr:MAG: hypothetical protein FD152_188 [Xanthobacteraceae bacterium]